METATKRHVYKPLLMTLLFLPLSIIVHAQLSYSFSVVTSTFVANSSPTTLIGSNQDDVTATGNIGFTFTYNCNTYTQFMVSSNGVMTLGTGMTGSLATNNLTNKTQGPILAPLW